MEERIFPTAISGLVQPAVDSVAARIHRRVAPTVTTVTRRIDRDSNRNPRHRGCWIRAKPIAKSPAKWRFRVDTRQRSRVSSGSESGPAPASASRACASSRSAQSMVPWIRAKLARIHVTADPLDS